MKGEKKDRSGLSRREFLYLSGFGTMGLGLSGMPQWAYGADKKPKYGGRLRVGQRFMSAGLDAHRNQDFADYINYCLFYQSLTEQGKLPGVEIHPFLAQSWEISADGREYTFALRRGVKFHHGKEMDSGDVKYSFERVLNPATRAPRASALRYIDSMQIIDKYHLKFRLKETFAPFLSAVSLYNCPIIPSGWEPTGTKPAPGTGPFAVKSYVPNETLELTRFDQYWEVDEETGMRLPYVDGIFLRKIVDDTVRLAGVRAGDLDMTSGPPLNIAAKAVLEKPLPGIHIDTDGIGNTYLLFNVSKPPFDNKKVRQAIAYALDKKEIARAVFWGLGEPLNNQAAVKDSRFYIPVQDREPDPARAKQLLAEAGYPNGFKTEFFQFSLNYYPAIAEVCSGQLKKIGIEATVKVIDRAPYFAMMRKGEYDLSIGNVVEIFDWDDAYYVHFHSGEVGKNNWSRYGSKELDGWLEKGRRTLKWEDRVAVYRKVIEIIREELPGLFLCKPVQAVAYGDQVKGSRKGFASRFAWFKGGAKYWWLDR
jgi:peptide/nickel transport system substrate-binding protein